nr:L-carnitine dehydratase/bile acid-inducible protein F [uncultured bacterium]
MTGAAGLPLDGIRVIEMGTMITAPLAATILAEMGAEVIKVERPEGDPFRAFMGGQYAPHFRAYNKNKASVTLDLSNEPDRQKLRQLLETADVLVENFRPGVMDRLGFPADMLARDFPRVPNFKSKGVGTEGPYRGRPACDTVARALSGIAHLKIDPAEPGISGPTTSDNVSGMAAAQGILAALVGRDRGQANRRVEVNMLEASIAFTPDSFAMADEGYDVDRLTRVRASQSYAMTSSDGKVLVVHLSSAVKFWEALLAAVDDPELSGNPKFATRDSRYEKYTEIQHVLAGLFRKRTLAEWVERLSANDVPFSPALTTNEVPENEQVRHLGTFTQGQAADGKSYRFINAPVRFDGKRPPLRRAPPLLGEDNDKF